MSRDMDGLAILFDKWKKSRYLEYLNRYLILAILIHLSIYRMFHANFYQPFVIIPSSKHVYLYIFTIKNN